MKTNNLLDCSPTVTKTKIYDLRLKRYRTTLEEFQPSWDGSFTRPRHNSSSSSGGGGKSSSRRPPASAAEYVARDLDQLNGRYEDLLDLLQRRMQQLCAAAQQEQVEHKVRVVCMFTSFYYVFLVHLVVGSESACVFCA